jgi:hypothetical protein
VLQAFGQTSVTHAIAAFAGLMAFPLAIPTHDAENAPVVRDTGGIASATDVPTPSCLATTICEVKDRVRWRTSAWKPAFCDRIANAVLDSSKRYAIPASLILAVMINESDMNENAFRTTMKGAHLYAKDGGLMGIRCIVDKQGHCTNGNVRGVAWSEVMDPVTNIDLGARELAHWKNGGGITNVTVRSRGRVLGTLQSWPAVHRSRTCPPLSSPHCRALLFAFACDEDEHVGAHINAPHGERSGQAFTHRRSPRRGSLSKAVRGHSRRRTRLQRSLDCSVECRPDELDPSPAPGHSREVILPAW